MIALRFFRKQKYEQPEEESKCTMDPVDSQETIVSTPTKHSMFKHAEADPLITATTESYQLKDAYTWPTSSVKNYYTEFATHEAHTVSLDIAAQSPKDDEGFETATLRSYRPSSSNSTIQLPPLIKLSPLIIPVKIPSNSNGDLSAKRTALSPLIIPRKISNNNSNGDLSIKRTAAVSRKSSIPFDPAGWESDDSASLYSLASASFSRSSQETIRPPPVPPIPVHFALPTQSTLPKGEGVSIVATTPLSDSDAEETISNKSLPPLPSFKLKRNNGEEEDETQIYNVAKLLQSRQSKLPKVPKDAVSRNASLVSHIERSGSISVVISPEESYRPRYYRLKQKMDHNKDSFSSSNHLSSHHIPYSPSSVSTLRLSTSNPLAHQLGS